MADDTTLPAPLVPAEVNLQDFEFMPLSVQRLRDSELVSNETPEACFAAVLLWCASWHQVPAASIPDDDQWMAKVAGYLARGRIDPQWKKVRAGALRGWVKCADGRLYHPVVAEKAREAWQGKLLQRWKTECARIKKHADRHGIKLARPEFDDWVRAGCPQGQPLPVPGDKAGEGEGQTGETASKGQGEGQGQGLEEDDDCAGARLGDDETPKTWEAWRRFFEAEHGVSCDPYAPHDREKLRPLAMAWVNAKVTVGQMRQAITQAQRQATEPIAYLPAYADRVLASLGASKRAPPPTESAYDRRMREQYLAIVPSVAAPSPAAAQPADFIDISATEVLHAPKRLR